MQSQISYQAMLSMNPCYLHARYRNIGHKRVSSSAEDQTENSSDEEEISLTEQTSNDKTINNDKLIYEPNKESIGNNVLYDDQVIDVTLGNKESDEEDINLVEGTDYEVIHYYRINPNIEGSDDEIDSSLTSDVIEVVSVDPNAEQINDSISIDVGSPSVLNVDDCIQNKEEEISNIKEVNDVDEYFNQSSESSDVSIKVETPMNIDTTLNESNRAYVDEYFVKPTSVEETSLKTEETCIEENSKLPTAEKSGINSEEVTNVMELILKDEVDVPPFKHLEELKNFLEDMPDTSFKSKPHKSCSFPTSPMRNLNMDVDVIKPSLTFEDLDLYFSDLPFDHIKEKTFNVDSKIDEVPRILTDEDVNGFFITDTNPTKEVINPNCDDLTHQDMELENTVESPLCISYMRSSTPVPQSVNEMETPAPKSVRKNNKTNMEVDDFIDVESCNDVVIPVLEANNVSSLLEQFEASEKLNSNPNNSKSNLNEPKNGLVSGMRLQDAGAQLHKNKIRKILMINTPVIRRSPSPVVSDHDYCSPKKAHNVSQLKSGQSLLKPEVLSRNNDILNSRHRSCKNKQVVYHQSSDEETEKKIKKNCKHKDLKHKKGKKTSNQNKLSPPHSDGDASNSKCNSTVIPNESVSKPSENGSQTTNGSIKLIIKNKSVIINNLVENITEENVKDVKLKSINTEKVEDDVKIENKSNHVNNIKSEPVDNNAPKNNNTEVTKPEQFYNELFTNKSDVKLPKNNQEKISKKSFEEEMKLLTINAVKKESEQTVKKRKLNLQEYKRRRVVGSNNSSAAVSPELIFPDLNCPVVDNVIVVPKTPLREMVKEIKPTELPKVFDPIAEASRKILLQTKKKKEKRKRDDDIIIPKVEITDLLPLITEPNLMTTSDEVPQVPVKSKRHSPLCYEEIILVSVGTNTDENVFSQIGSQIENKKTKQISDSKSHINFKIKKSDHVSKENVFDSTTKSRHIGEKSENKNNKDRYKDIAATLKSVEKKVETKITSNSLFASIQDVVMKKATKDVKKSDKDNRISKSNSATEKFNATTLPIKTEIIRDFDVAMEHGEDKVILHLEKCRKKPNTSDGVTQTVLPALTAAPAKRCRKDSDMSIESDGSPVRPSTHIVEQKESKTVKSDNRKEFTVAKTDVKALKRSRSNERLYTSHEKRSKSREKNSRFKLRRSRSKDRRSRTKYPIRRSRSKHRRSRSRSRRSKSRRSRSYDHYRYRRSVSPYRTNRRLRSPCRSRRSPSYNRDYCKRSRSKSKSTKRHRIASPAPKKIKIGPQTNQQSKNQSPSRLPKLNTTRKPTISESSSSSSSSSSSLSSSSSSSSSFTSFSEKSKGSYKSQKSSNYKNDTVRRKETSPFTLEDRENNKPVEERRIVFVGKLERDITKQNLCSKFSKFGYIIEVRIHSKEDGTRYGFVTYERARDACTAVESASQFPQYDVGFGGRRAFCRQSYADLDGLKEYVESSFHGPTAMPSRRNEDMSFEQMLMDVKKKLSQRKNEQKQEKP